MDWVSIMRQRDQRFWQVFAVPNAGRRGYVAQRRFHLEGGQAGVSDILIFHPSDCGHYHGAALELKVGKNRLTQAQARFLERSLAAGMLVRVIKDFDLFQRVLMEFFGYQTPLEILQAAG